MTIMRAHARRHLDREMIRRLAVDNGWDVEGVMRKYSHGVNWRTLRDILNNPHGKIDQRERRLLLVISCGGFWPEERRWRKGLCESAACGDCGDAPATPRHRIHDCIALASKEVEWRLLGIVGPRPAEMNETALAPLTCMALPPVRWPWKPVELHFVEGEMEMGHERTHGDGSGYLQDDIATRVATWSLIAMGETSGCHQPQRIRGLVTGWQPTVPRAEAQAFVEHAKRAGPNSTYVSDCRYIVDTVRDDIPRERERSRDANADIWREVRRLRNDRDEPFTIVKVKAHRTRSRAEHEAQEETDLLDWRGNQAADEYAKALARDAVQADGRDKEMDYESSITQQIIIRVAKGAGAAFERWPQTHKGSGLIGADLVEDGHQIPPEERHLLRRAHDGGVECIVCRRTARGDAGKRLLEKEACAGEIGHRIHSTHVIRETNGVTWCVRCGCFTSRWPRALLAECRGRPNSVAQKNVLRRLQNGLPPTTAEYLHVVAQHEGCPGGAYAHAAETSWRESPAAAPTFSSTATSGLASDGGGRRKPLDAKPPVGRYLRLRGGPLHQPSLSASTGAAADAAASHHQRALHATIPPGVDQRVRRRLRGKQPPLAAVSSVPGQNDLVDVGGDVHSYSPSLNAEQADTQSLHVDPPRRNYCEPQQGEPWASRVRIPREPVNLACMSCMASTRIRCRGCEGPVCLVCARQQFFCRHHR